MKRLAFNIDDDTLAGIDEFRRRQRDLPSRPEALRRLVTLALKSTAPRFDKVAYQREYMRKRRAAAKAELLDTQSQGNA